MYLNNRKHGVKQSTYAKYQRDINNHLKPYWNNILLKDVNIVMIEKFTNNLMSHGSITSKEELSPKTVKDLIVLLKSAIIYANQRELCSINTVYISTPNVRKNNIQTLSREEQKILENYIYRI